VEERKRVGKEKEVKREEKEGEKRVGNKEILCERERTL